MQRRTDSYVMGQRYLLQFPGGMERLAEVDRPLAGAGAALRALPYESPLPPRTVPGGEWLLEPGERLVRDWAGLYWSVAAAPADPARVRTGELPAVCDIRFTRREPDGEIVAYEASSLAWPERLSDSALAGILRRAWDALVTNDTERRRRSRGRRSAMSGL